MLFELGIIALLIFVVPPRWRYWFTLGVIGAGAAVACAVAGATFLGVTGPTPLLHPFLHASLDRLSALFLVIIAGAGVSTALYARDYLKPYEAKKPPVHFAVHYLALMWMFLAMSGVVAARESYTFLLCWELMTLASFVLILFEGERRETRRAAINYLILMHIGFVFLVSGSVFWAGAGSASLPVFLLFLVGFGMKAGIFPLHIWLPEAHPAAPSHVSALMSGVMIKMGVYGIVRVVAAVDAGLQTAGIVLLVIGMVTALWGIVQAAGQNDLKKGLAYSSIENIGIIFTALGLAALGMASGNAVLAVLGGAGALLHTLNHSLFKPLLFMGAGSVYTAAHTRNLDELGGLSQRMPATTALFGLGAVAICALPPLNGFVSEFLICLGALRSIASGSQIIWSAAALLVLALTGGFAVLVFARFFGTGFLGAPRSAKAARAREVSTLMLAAQLIPLAGMVLIGLFPVFVTRIVLSVTAGVFRTDFAGADFGAWGGHFTTLSWVMGVLLALIAGLWYLRRRMNRGKTIAESPTWGCGFTAPDARMQYTGESFSEGLQHLSNSTSHAGSHRQRRGGAVPKEDIFAGEQTFGIRRKDRIDRIVSDRWVYLVRKVNARLALFQTGKINHYILHALLFLVFIFLISWIGWV